QARGGIRAVGLGKGENLGEVAICGDAKDAALAGSSTWVKPADCAVERAIGTEDEPAGACGVRYSVKSRISAARSEFVDQRFPGDEIRTTGFEVCCAIKHPVGALDGKAVETGSGVRGCVARGEGALGGEL